MKARALVAIPVIVALLLTSACRNTGGTNEPGGPGAGPTLSDVIATDINPKERGQVKDGGTLRLSTGDVAEQWNISHTNGNDAATVDILNLVFPRTFYVNDKGEPTWDPTTLAAEPQVKVEGGKQTVTFAYNEKAVWADGAPLVANDFIATWKALNGTNEEFRAASSVGWDQIENVTQGATEREVIINFKSTYPDWTSLTSTVLRADSVKDPQTFNEGWKFKDGKGGPQLGWTSGPFKIESITDEMVTLARNEKWYGEPAKLDKVTFKSIPDLSAVANAYKNNEIDAFEVGPDPNNYKIATAKGQAVRKAAAPSFRQITFNTKAGNLADQAVRQAIVMGLDREKVARSDLAGLDWPAKPLNNMIMMQNQPAYVDLAEKTGIKFDVEKAKQTLEAAGWKPGPDGIRVKDGKKLDVTFTVLATVKASENEGLQLQNQLKPIGINIIVNPRDAGKFNDYLNQKQYELMAFSWIGTPYPYESYGQIYKTGANNNFTGSEIKEVDDRLQAIDTETDKTKRQAVGLEAAEAIWKYVHTLPLYQRPDIQASVKNLANWGAFGMANPMWENVGFEKDAA